MRTINRDRVFPEFSNTLLGTAGLDGRPQSTGQLYTIRASLAVRGTKWKRYEKWTAVHMSRAAKLNAMWYNVDVKMISRRDRIVII